MNNNELKSYVAMVADVENDIYTKNQLIEQLKEYRDQLGIRRQIKEPREPSAPVFSETGKGAIYGSIVGQFVLAGLGALVGTVLVLDYWPILPYLAFGFSVLMLFSAIIAIDNNRVEKVENAKQFNKEYEDYLKRKSIYETQKVHYYEELQEEDARIERELKEKDFVSVEIQEVMRYLDLSEKNLEKIYSANIVYPKYRGFTRINTILEYLDSGKCDSLEGRYGAYNLLDQEMVMNTIVTELKDINRKLDRISTNQYALFSAVQQTNAITQEMVRSTQEISTKLDEFDRHQIDYTDQISELQKNSEISKYNLENLDKEIHYLNKMKYLSGDYDKAGYAKHLIP